MDVSKNKVILLCNFSIIINIDTIFALAYNAYLYKSIAPTVPFTEIPPAQNRVQGHTLYLTVRFLQTFKIRNGSSAFNVFNGIFKDHSLFFYVISLNLYFSDVSLYLDSGYALWVKYYINCVISKYYIWRYRISAFSYW